MIQEKSNVAETSDEDPRFEYSDVEIFFRPAGTGKRSEEEQVWSFSYREFSQWATHNICDFVGDTVTEITEGEYKVGIRERGDEQYFQRFGIVSPHAEERGRGELMNHLQGVMRHWRG